LTQVVLGMQMHAYSSVLIPAAVKLTCDSPACSW